MIVLGIDPGPEKSGVAIYRSVPTLGVNGVVEPEIETWKVSNFEVRASLRYWRHSMDLIAIERMQGMGKRVGREVFETCEWIGRFIEVCSVCHHRVRLVYRTQVKGALCGDARATDAKVRAALIERFGAPGTKKNPGLTFGIKADAWSALAVAVVALDQNVGPRD